MGFPNEVPREHDFFRKLGETGLLVSVLGLGASALGGVFHEIAEDECIRVVRGNFLHPLLAIWQPMIEYMRCSCS
jgi:hypothetical protein